MIKNSDHAAERPDDDNPELTRAEIRKARPARHVLPDLIGVEAATDVLKGRGEDRAARTSRKEPFPVQK